MERYHQKKYSKRSTLNIGASCLILVAIMIIISFMCNSCQAQVYVAKAVAWDYDFAPYEWKAVHFIIYAKVDADTSFAVLDTTAGGVLEYDLLNKPWLYNFKWRSFNATAILYDGLADDWSYESKPSNTAREYFRTLPPAPIDTVDGLRVKMIELGKVPPL